MFIFHQVEEIFHLSMAHFPNSRQGVKGVVIMHTIHTLSKNGGRGVTSSSLFSPLMSFHPSKHELVIGLLASSSVNADEHIMSCCVQSNMISETIGCVSITSSRCNFIITEAKSLTCRQNIQRGTNTDLQTPQQICSFASGYVYFHCIWTRDIMLCSMEV